MTRCDFLKSEGALPLVDPARAGLLIDAHAMFGKRILVFRGRRKPIGRQAIDIARSQVGFVNA